MIIALEIVLLLGGLFALIASYGIEDLNKRILSTVMSLFMFILLMMMLGAFR